ncbi:DnaA N-terminal domain-containing protein [Bacillus sp. FJAT-27245]|uniref:DnaA N-terminal domain-containing protein n=1 Tax=Bacillus sp. FJAT-27245 TaxID=1684144 RepID=UPI0006A7668D|nr:DnaA N-terminal domain-containing protein [Bacillus sp. FJAT-27245]
MCEHISEEMVKKIDEERIKQALENGKWFDAMVLFKYSALTKEEFNQIQQSSSSYDQQLKDYIKEKDTKRIEKALAANQNQAADYIFWSSELTGQEYENLKHKYKVTKTSGTANSEMKNQKADIWGEILTIISSEISTPSFETWFKKTEVQLEGNTLIISCDNSFQKDWLRERYLELISSSAEKVLGKTVDIKFYTEDQEW